MRPRALRQTLAAAGAGGGAAAIACYLDDDTRRTLTIGTVGTLCRAFILGLNRMTLHDEHHLRTALDRPKGTALLSVSNHIATIDDPHLLSSIVPYGTLWRGSEMRWGVCASDVCFRDGSILKRLADSAKVLPVQRHGGVWQAELDTVHDKLKDGDWVRATFERVTPTRRGSTLSVLHTLPASGFRRAHACRCACTCTCAVRGPPSRAVRDLWCVLHGQVHFFPEGKIRQDGRIHPFRRGVGRLVLMSADDPGTLQVLPFFHMGNEVLQPTRPTAVNFFSWPALNTEIHVIFGAPVDLSRYLALRTQPPFDRNPELLFEVVAHALEEEVRGLRTELRRRLELPPFELMEKGTFGEYNESQHQHAPAQAMDVTRRVGVGVPPEAAPH